MQSAEFLQKIRAAWRLLNDQLQLARAVSSLVSLGVDSEFNEVALDPTANYREIYLAAISRSYYNILLNDYSVFQFSWSGSHAWRLAYLPNPWIAGSADASELIEEWEVMEELGALGQEDVASLVSELPYRASVPPIRFEFASGQYRELAHPAAHMHIGRHTENRWALARVLNPLTFTMLIVKMYYGEEWGRLSSYYQGDANGCLDIRLIEELGQSQLVHDFSLRERQSLHFSSQHPGY